MSTLPADGAIKPAAILSKVDLPQPVGTDDGHELAVGHRQRGALDRRIGPAIGEPEGDRAICERDGDARPPVRARLSSLLRRRLTIPTVMPRP